jgi:hypothetical protein
MYINNLLFNINFVNLLVRVCVCVCVGGGVIMLALFKPSFYEYQLFL